MTSLSHLQLWGGVECTVNRVGSRYFEQLDRTGHITRIDDLDRFAALGIKALRQPLLWERACRSVADTPDWRWSDQWLQRLKDLSVRPIAGLVHHGSGPLGTDLLDPEFPQKLSAYAELVARRYPWIDAYTPVNEPLTTARFSALYGLWYPHRRDDRSFVTALLNQCRAVVLAMRAIRQVNSNAELIQTDDIGQTYATPRLQYQAEFENERRWLTFDLICGKVNQQHPLWSFLIRSGAPERELLWFADHPCPPNVIGMNYYLSSERFLDERIHLYPHLPVGGNGIERYIDVEAARVWADSLAGATTFLTEGWKRYGIPLAITECHNGCTREEQMRWVRDVWQQASTARELGTDVRAVTLWSLLGAFDWDTLVTQENNRYESGVFDIRAPEPRGTAVAELATQLAKGCEPTHPVLSSPGWWKRSSRFTFGFSVRRDGALTPNRQSPAFPQLKVRPLLITGGTGTLGRAFARECLIRGIDFKLTTRAELDVADKRSVRAALAAYNPWAIVNTAGYVRVDDAESDVTRCFRENATGPAVLARECAKHALRFVTFSSDLVFDGTKSTPYVESDNPSPVNVYGRSKVEAERTVLSILPSAMIVRTSAFFSPWDEYNFVTQTLRELAAGRQVSAEADVFVSPTYVPDLVKATLDLLIDGASNIFHLANAGSTTWAGLARTTAELMDCDPDLVRPCLHNELRSAAQRPEFSVLGSERTFVMPSLEDALSRYVVERGPITDARLLAA
ncbi:MAG: SDR family oxidoreductase [Acidobacteriales bacterium]|nr:SDR family oxidoreductase [Terriglobales bacterium]